MPSTGFSNGTMCADNVCFNGTRSPEVAADGQLLIGATVAPNLRVAVPTNGNNITWTLGAGSIKPDLTGTTDHSIQLGNASGSLTSLGVATNGQIPIGSTGANPVLSTLTAGTGISITNAAGSITINGVGSGLTWTAVGAGGALVVNNGYICTAGAALSFSLPATSAVGSVIALILDGSTSWTVTQAANQQIRFGAVQTTLGVGGSLATTAQGDAIFMVCSVADLKWNVFSSIGNITIV